MNRAEHLSPRFPETGVNGIVDFGRTQAYAQYVADFVSDDDGPPHERQRYC
jgi:hypothetical protein